MDADLRIGVTRRLDNRLQNLPDDSPCAISLHERRRNALHTVLDPIPTLLVKDWGQTDDRSPHEFIELVLAVTDGAILDVIAGPGLKWLGDQLAALAVDAAALEAARFLIAKLRPKQQSRELLDFVITLPDGTTVRCDPPGQDATVTVMFASGAKASAIYRFDNPT